MPDVRDFPRRWGKLRARRGLLHPDASDPAGAFGWGAAEHLLQVASQPRMRPRIFAAALLVWLASLVASTTGQRLPAALLRNHPAISYERAPVSNAVTQLNARLQRGEVTLESKGPSGYLESVLNALR